MERNIPISRLPLVSVIMPVYNKGNNSLLTTNFDVKDSERISVNLNPADLRYAIKEHFFVEIEEENIKPEELFSLDETIGKFVLPRLKKFREIEARVMKEGTGLEWLKTLDNMIAAFEIVCDGQRYYPFIHNEKDKNIFKKGMKEFCTYFSDLWY